MAKQDDTLIDVSNNEMQIEFIDHEQKIEDDRAQLEAAFSFQREQTWKIARMIDKFLDNFIQHPEKEVIKWPTRVKDISKFRESLVDEAQKSYHRESK